jgi:hypothetical protein
MPRKEEFPTFLNEQPTIIFGRTGRELLVIVLGIVCGYFVWGALTGIRADLGWQLLTWTLSAVPILIALVVALMPVAERPLEEWFFVWLMYIGMPRLYLYKPREEDVEEGEMSEDEEKQKRRDARPIDPDELQDD